MTTARLRAIVLCFFERGLPDVPWKAEVSRAGGLRKEARGSFVQLDLEDQRRIGNWRPLDSFLIAQDWVVGQCLAHRPVIVHDRYCTSPLAVEFSCVICVAIPGASHAPRERIIGRGDGNSDAAALLIFANKQVRRRRSAMIAGDDVAALVERPDLLGVDMVSFPDVVRNVNGMLSRATVIRTIVSAPARRITRSAIPLHRAQMAELEDDRVE